MRDVAIIGIGVHPWGKFKDRTLNDITRVAVDAALADAGVAWTDVEALSSASSRFSGGRGWGLNGNDVVEDMGATGIPVYNLSASGAAGCWGAQVNAGSEVQDYVPTSGASASAGASSFTLDMAALGLSDTETFNYERDGGSTGTISAVGGTLTLPNGYTWEKIWA